MTTNKYTIDDEIRLEAQSKQEARDRLEEIMANNVNEGNATETTLGRRMLDFSFDNFADAVKMFVEKELAPKRGVQATYHDVVVRINDIYGGKVQDVVSLFTLTTLSVTMNSVLSKHNILNGIIGDVAKEIEDEAHLQAYVRSNPSNLKQFETGISRRSGEHYRKYYAFNKAMKEEQFPWTPFGKEVSHKLAGKLMEMLLTETGLFECFDSIEEGKQAPTKVVPTQRYIDIWNANETVLLENVFHSIPMIVKPDAWTSFEDGGYYGELRHHFKLLRLHGYKSIFYFNYMKRLKQANLSKVFKAINAVQETPWVINREVLSIVHAVIKNGGGYGGIPLMNPLPEIPRLEGDYTEEELKAHKKKMYNRVKADLSRKAKAMRCLSMVSVADKFSKYDHIYFPCNMDFRGRVYPIPTFSFQGDDLTKGLLLMQDTPPCTDEKAEFWFRVAGCEFFGNDKISFDNQIIWTKDNEENILSVANDPLGKGKDFWANSDCPIEFLGWCLEYKKMLDYKKTHNNSVIGWTCGVPVAFDGTCSGLQHFSAALRDEIGGRAVNLIKGDKPRDIYGIVAEKVNVMLKDDAVNGTEDKQEKNKKGELVMKWGTKTLAQQWLMYGVNRKVTKRCVMTLAYGSKQYGFKGQIIEDTLEPAIQEGRGDMFTASKFQLATYLAKLIWKSVTKTVVKAVEGMKWLQEVSSMVCEEGKPVMWTTPMGLPIQQNYMQVEVHTFWMRFLNTKKRFYVPEETGEIAGRKQTQGIAPNFIHSMDASHLQWSLNMAVDKGIHHFSMIHDSYATCPSQADTLFHTVREAFVEMYTKHDVLAEFREDMELLISEDKQLPEPPTKGSLDIKEVLESLYMFH